MGAHISSVVTLIFGILQVLLREGSLHAPLDGTTYLGMHVKSLSDDLVPAMVSVLRGMPNLKTLYLNFYPSLNVAKPKVSEPLPPSSVTQHTVYQCHVRL